MLHALLHRGVGEKLGVIMDMGLICLHTVLHGMAVGYLLDEGRLFPTLGLGMAQRGMGAAGLFGGGKEWAYPQVRSAGTPPPPPPGGGGGAGRGFCAGCELSTKWSGGLNASIMFASVRQTFGVIPAQAR